MKTLRTGFALALPALALSLAACGKSHDVANNQAEIAGDNVTVNDEDALAGNLDDATFANASDANAADANAIAPIGNAQQ